MLQIVARRELSERNYDERYPVDSLLRRGEKDIEGTYVEIPANEGKCVNEAR